MFLEAPAGGVSKERLATTMSTTTTTTTLSHARAPKQGKRGAWSILSLWYLPNARLLGQKLPSEFIHSTNLSFKYHGLISMFALETMKWSPFYQKTSKRSVRRRRDDIEYYNDDSWNTDAFTRALIMTSQMKRNQNASTYELFYI